MIIKFRKFDHDLEFIQIYLIFLLIIITLILHLIMKLIVINEVNKKSFISFYKCSFVNHFNLVYVSFRYHKVNFSGFLINFI
jgi:hypothetical protein